MKEKENTNNDEQTLREARRRYAAASVVKRYELARNVTGMTSTERVALVVINQLTKK